MASQRPCTRRRVAELAAAAASGPSSAPSLLGRLPDDLLAVTVQHLGSVQDLLNLQACGCARLAKLAANDDLWRARFIEHFGPPSKLHLAAHKLAGCWQALFKAKQVTDKAASPWRKPCAYELQAALQAMLHTDGDSGPAPEPASPRTACSTDAPSSGGSCPGPAPGRASNASSPGPAASSSESSCPASPRSSAGSNGEPAAPGASADSAAKTQLAVVFLVDSSGSVGDEDFACMTEFLSTAAQAVAALHGAKLSVIQFSNDTRVEVPLGPLDPAAFSGAVKAMSRLNGGTNIAAAVAKAGALLKADADAGKDTRRVLVLLTDGRIDSYQAREAAAMVSRLADEQANLALWALGVGRGVDSAELVRIVEGACPGSSAGAGRERYVELCVRDDAPW